MKTCTKCGVEKPQNEFYSHRDGLHPHCKECVKAAVRARHQRNPERQNNYKRRHYAENLADERAKRREYERLNRKAAVRRVRAWKTRNPEKVRAQNAAAKAIQSGRLIRPEKCQRCPSIGPLGAHHHDYSKPLEVEWLCIDCHVIADRERRAREAAA